MPNSLISRLLFLALATLLWSCETDQDEEGNQAMWASAYAGSWEMRENSGPQSPQVYTVQLENSSGLSGEVVIKGIYNLSESSINAYAIAPNRLEIPFQMIDDEGRIGIRGEGRSDRDYTEVEWRWIVQESGVGTDSVQATMKR